MEMVISIIPHIRKILFLILFFGLNVIVGWDKDKHSTGTTKGHHPHHFSVQI